MLKKKNKFYAKRIKNCEDKSGFKYFGQWAILIENENGQVFYKPSFSGQNVAVILAENFNELFKVDQEKALSEVRQEFKQLENDNEIL